MWRAVDEETRRAVGGAESGEPKRGRVVGGWWKGGERQGELMGTESDIESGGRGHEVGKTRGKSRQKRRVDQREKTQCEVGMAV